MRTYPSDKYDKEELERLNAEPWMVELLKCNPGYPFWGNYEDYMIKDSGWDARAEIENVSDLWELNDLNEVVNFYFEIIRESHKCESCDGRGLNPETGKFLTIGTTLQTLEDGGVRISRKMRLTLFGNITDCIVILRKSRQQSK